MQNLLDPLTFEDGEVDVFIRDHVCAFCQGHLNKFPAPGRKWTVKCLIDGPVLSHNTITTRNARQMESDRLAAMRELR